MSDHVAAAFGGAAASASRRSSGTSGSGSTATGGNLERDEVANFHARGSAELLIDSQPMAPSAVRLEGGPKGGAMEGAFHRRHTPRGELRALASVGKVRKVEVTPFSVAFGRQSFAVKRIIRELPMWGSMPMPSAAEPGVVSRHAGYSGGGLSLRCCPTSVATGRHSGSMPHAGSPVLPSARRITCVKPGRGGGRLRRRTPTLSGPAADL